MNFVTNVFKKIIQNDTSEVVKVTMEEKADASDKENPKYADTIKLPPNEDLNSASGNPKKPRISLLRAFDPLSEQSPLKENYLQVPSQRKQLVIEDSDSDKGPSLGDLSDVSDDNEAFVDATNDSTTLPPNNLDVKRVKDALLIQFNTPEKQNSYPNLPTQQLNPLSQCNLLDSSYNTYSDCANTTFDTITNQLQNLRVEVEDSFKYSSDTEEFQSFTHENDFSSKPSELENSVKSENLDVTFTNETNKSEEANTTTEELKNITVEEVQDITNDKVNKQVIDEEVNNIAEQPNNIESEQSAVQTNTTEDNCEQHQKVQQDIVLSEAQNSTTEPNPELILLNNKPTKDQEKPDTNLDLKPEEAFVDLNSTQTLDRSQDQEPAESQSNQESTSELNLTQDIGDKSAAELNNNQNLDKSPESSPNLDELNTTQNLDKSTDLNLTQNLDKPVTELNTTQNLDKSSERNVTQNLDKPVTELNSTQNLNKSNELNVTLDKPVTELNTTQNLDKSSELNVTQNPDKLVTELNSTQSLDKTGELNITLDKPVTELNTTQNLDKSSELNVTQNLDQPELNLTQNLDKSTDKSTNLNATQTLDNSAEKITELNVTQTFDKSTADQNFDGHKSADIELNSTHNLNKTSDLTATEPVERPTVLNLTQNLDKTSEPVDNPTDLNLTQNLDTVACKTLDKTSDQGELNLTQNLDTDKLVETPNLVQKLDESVNELNTTQTIETPHIQIVDKSEPEAPLNEAQEILIETITDSSNPKEESINTRRSSSILRKDSIPSIKDSSTTVPQDISHENLAIIYSQTNCMNNIPDNTFTSSDIDDELDLVNNSKLRRKKVEIPSKKHLQNPDKKPELNKAMGDLTDKFTEQQQEISDLKLQLNALQQARASLELEVRQKEEIVIKTQAESLKKEQEFRNEIKDLKEKLKEHSKLIEKSSTKELEEQLKEAREKAAQAINELKNRNEQESNEDYKKIMEEYEKSLAAKNAQCEELKEINETAERHLGNLELAFSDVHQKYERSKALIIGYKANEETMKFNLLSAERTIRNSEERYESLKTHAKNQIERSNKELVQMKKSYEEKELQLTARIKRLEILCKSLEVSLEQKTNECLQLAALCDDITGKNM